MPTGQRYFRLRGELDGEEIVIELQPGVLRVGSYDDNDIVLPAHGVSRHHALLRVAETGAEEEMTLGDPPVRIEDLGSKNGTRLNGKAIHQGAADTGDQLFFGPTRWTLEAVDASDVSLAVELDEHRRLLDVQDLTPGHVRLAAPDGDVALIEHLLDRLTEGIGRTAALEAVASKLGLTGASWLDWPDRGPYRALASWGLDFRALLDPQDLFLRAESLAGSRRVVVLETAGPPALAAAVLLDRRRPQALLAWDSPQLEAPLLRVAMRLLARHAGEIAAPSGPLEIEKPEGYVDGGCPALRPLHRRLVELAGDGSPVLIAGEPGAGKKKLAELLHATAGKTGPFVITGCADLTDAALAQGFRVVAEGRGTLLLDELADLEPALHEPVLQLLDGPTDRARLVLTTARDLTELADDGTLPTELYLRLSRRVVVVPPLRERKDQIPHLVGHFFRHAPRGCEDRRGITVEALRRLMLYRWPGNVGELRLEVERLVEACIDAHAIESLSLPEAFQLAAT